MDDAEFQFFVDVDLAATDLQSKHGSNAWMEAEKLAEAADQRGDVDDQKFWRAVTDSLRPRANLSTY